MRPARRCPVSPAELLASKIVHLISPGTVLFLLLGAAWAGADDDIVIGRRVQIHSQVLDEVRTLEIRLPKDYESSEKSYPVLIVLDGGRWFQYCVSLIHMISPNHLPEMIVVGLPNTDRRRDMDPLAGDPSSPEKGTQNFLRFLRQELLPHLEEEYRASSYRILAGHSLAGYFTLYSLAREPELFDAHIATSPALTNPARTQVLRDAFSAGRPERYAGQFVYFSAGGAEGEEFRKAIGVFDDLLGSLAAPRLVWASEIFEKESHVPIKGFYQGLRNLFAGYVVSLDILTKGDMEDLRDHYSSLSSKYGFVIAPPADALGGIGRRLLREGETAKAIDVFASYVSFYPVSAEAYLFLGKAHQEANRFPSAVENVRKALELDPENEEARSALEELMETMGNKKD